MNQETYRKAMERFQPDPALRGRISEAVEGRAHPRPRVRPLRAVLLAAAACAALAGTAGDGRTAKRVFESDASAASYGLRRGQRYVETRYQAERASDYGGLFDRWDLSWLEERYTANPCGSFARTIEYRDGLRLIAVGGEYHGEDGGWFNITWSWDGSSSYGDEYRAVGNKQFAELYTTADGMEVDIEMDTSDTGKSVFWVSLEGGHCSFGMHGTQVELEELHAILDSLNLSRVLDYDPTK